MSNSTKTVALPDVVTVRDLAELVNVSPIELIKRLMTSGIMANINQEIDFDTAALILDDLGFEAQPESVEPAEAEDLARDEQPAWRRQIAAEDAKDLVTRPPVVTIMGHVDHGKTSLLDAIRHTDVAAGEAGGITQHIGAYQITHDGRKITFLDTPGHAAFTAMRARGAQATDIAVLVVAADDGVMPQTREAANHARAAHVPVLVAMNKVDRPNANAYKVRQQLADIGLVPDDWDGDTMVVEVSAKERLGIEDLLEAILLTADDNPIVANPNARIASGTVVEAQIERGRGTVATVLVQNGTLKTGDAIVAGTAAGRIRAMFDDKGNKVTSADPSTPVSITGLSEVPNAGDLFEVVKSATVARKIAADRQAEQDAARKQRRRGSNLEQLFAAFEAGEVEELRLVVKADVSGSLEPVVESLEKLSNAEIKIKIIHSDVGDITESDILLASASDATAIGFNVHADNNALALADTEGVDIRTYDIIYRLTEDIEKALKGQLGPELVEETLGKAEVRATFDAGRKLGTVAGCRVVEGELRRNAKVRVHRGKKVVYEGNEISSLRRERDDAREVRQGFECGVGLQGFDAWKVGDIIESYHIVEK